MSKCYFNDKEKCTTKHNQYLKPKEFPRHNRYGYFNIELTGGVLNAGYQYGELGKEKDEIVKMICHQRHICSKGF